MISKNYTYYLKISYKQLFLIIVPYFLIAVSIFSANFIVDKIKNNLGILINIKFEKFTSFTSIPEIKPIETKDIIGIVDKLNIKIESKVKNKETEPQVMQHKKTNGNPPSYTIKLIYIGSYKKYVVINDKLLIEGSKISENEKIVKIEKDRILLDGKWGKRWIYIMKEGKE